MKDSFIIVCTLLALASTSSLGQRSNPSDAATTRPSRIAPAPARDALAFNQNSQRIFSDAWNGTMRICACPKAIKGKIPVVDYSRIEDDELSEQDIREITEAARAVESRRDIWFIAVYSNKGQGN